MTPQRLLRCYRGSRGGVNFRPGHGSLRRNHLYIVERDLFIGGEDGDVLQLSLGDEKAIKGISVVPG